MINRSLVIHTDGGARGNPGPAAIGVVVEQDGRVVERLSRVIGETTNNQAEYQAVHAALEWAEQHRARRVDLYADSELIVKQLRQEYKIKNKELAPWFLKIHSLANRIGAVRFHHVTREHNAHADELVNQALDRQTLGGIGS
ncbi:MAG: ribonuclease HI family protein [Patescibacteria group bacterium]